MSKPVKNMIVDMYKQRFGEINEAMLIDIRGIAANPNNELRTGLADKGIRITVLKNTLAHRAFTDTGLEPLTDLVEGPSALVYSTNEDVSVVQIAREMLDWVKKVKELELKGAVLDGAVFGPDQIKQLSDFPTKEEALAEVVQLILSPASQMVSTVTGGGSQAVALVDAIREKLEAGETIAAG